jgi:hypothetical protein
VIAAFSSSARVDARGEVRAQLLPGKYRIRVTPPGASVVDLGLLAGFESTLTVWPDDGGGAAAQAGRVIEVPPAISLEGRVVTASGSPERDGQAARAAGTAIRGVEVRASSGSLNRGACPQPLGSQDPAQLACERRRAIVLRDALAEDPFVPRTRSAHSTGDGRFRVDGLDCGQCRPGSGARFDVSIRPSLEAGLAWQVRHSVDLYTTSSIETFRLPTPAAARLRLTYGGATPAAQSSPRALSGALVRAYVLVDDQSELVRDPRDLVPCVAMPIPGGGRCLRSLLQVAEMRSGADGELLLLLPPAEE